MNKVYGSGLCDVIAMMKSGLKNGPYLFRPAKNTPTIIVTFDK